MWRRSRAPQDPSGRFYTVTGEKKWITNGVFCDYFTVAVCFERGGNRHSHKLVPNVRH